MGWLFRDLEDAPLLGSFFAVRERLDMRAFTQFGIVSDEFLYDCEPDVVAGYQKRLPI